MELPLTVEGRTDSDASPENETFRAGELLSTEDIEPEPWDDATQQQHHQQRQHQQQKQRQQHLEQQCQQQQHQLLNEFFAGDVEPEPWAVTPQQQQLQWQQQQQTKQQQRLDQPQQPRPELFSTGDIDPEPWAVTPQHGEQEQQRQRHNQQQQWQQQQHQQTLLKNETLPNKKETFRAEEFFSAPGEVGQQAPPEERQSTMQRSPQPLDTLELLSRSDEIVLPHSEISKLIPKSPQLPPQQAVGIGIPLRQWVRAQSSASKSRSSLGGNKASVLAKTTVAYAIAQSLGHYLKNHPAPGGNQPKKNPSLLAPVTEALATTGGTRGDQPAPQALAAASSGGRPTQPTFQVVCHLDNFVVRVADSDSFAIEGVDMVSPQVTLRVTTPFFLSDEFWKDENGQREGGQQEEMGRFVEVQIQGVSNDVAVDSADSELNSSKEDVLCHLFGVLLYELYSGTLPFACSGKGGASSMDDNEINFKSGHTIPEEEPLRKKTVSDIPSFRDKSKGKNFVDLTLCEEDAKAANNAKDSKSKASSSEKSRSRDGDQKFESGPARSRGEPSGKKTLSDIPPARAPNNGKNSFHDQSNVESNRAAKERPPKTLSEEPLHERASDVMSFHGPNNVKNISDLSLCDKSKSAANDGTHDMMASAPASQVPTRQDSGDKVSRISSPSKYVPLKELGLPASISLLVRNLLDCGWDEFRPDDAMPSLKAAIEDLHLLLLDPDRFLFDRCLTKNSAGGTGKGVGKLDVKQNKLYGRESESSLVADAFCRVSSTGESEALFVEGYSGSGKSSLVRSVASFVDFSGGYVAQRKFDQVSQERPMSVVVGAFNDLCPLIREKSSLRELNSIVANLMAVFSGHLSTLARLLPSVALLSPELNALTSSGRGGSVDMNLGSAYSILQLFARVVSSRSHPIMLFLDDLHWADDASLDGLQYILSDPHGCIYVVCSYRINEVPSDHAVFRLAEVLRACNVPLSRVRLDGMSLEDVNHMISDALGTFPRACEPLSRLVLRRTEGNPLFVLECLRSLEDRGLLRYSVRERRWEWDADAIAAEGVADNVCELFRAKMIDLPDATRSALKIAACFGMTLASTVVDALTTASPEFDGLRGELRKLVDDGFMVEDGSISLYRFVHDKVREAAYGLIPEQERNQFHYGIGSILHSTLHGEDDDMIFLIVDQINHGAIGDPRRNVAIAAMNHKAASKAMGNFNFAAAYFYSNAAVEHLPRDHWESHYELSRSVFLVLGNAAYSDGHGDKAMSALDEILSHGKSLKDKLDAYYLKSALLNARQEPNPAYDTCVEVLRQLGETIPSSVEPITMAQTVRGIKSKLDEMTEGDFMSMRTMDSPFHYSLMQFYSQVCYLSYFVHTPMLKWFACRLVEISLEHGFCKYSALGIMRFSMVLGGKLVHDIRGGYEVGKVALKLLERFDATDLLPCSYLCYYGFIAVHIEPFQSCADMLKRGFEIGLSNADTQMAFLSGIHFIQKSFVSGANLSVLKKECDYQMQLIEAHSQPMTKMYMAALQETLAVLISREAPSKNWSEEDVSRVGEFSEAIIFHGVVQNFWLGRYDRCLYYADRSKASSDIGKMKSILIIFYGGLSCFHSSRKISKKNTKTAKQALGVVRDMREKSSWNYQCKFLLLEAEMASANGDGDLSKASFDSAISSARSSKFVHEEGLACELAALHRLRLGEKEEASDLFERARECYAKWGSQVKVDHITEKLERVAANAE